MGSFQPLLGHGTIWTEWSVDPRMSGASEDWIRYVYDICILIIITNKCLKCSLKEKGEEALMMLVFKVL